ncbi:MAG: hypothetical protein LQ350_008514 [Teloschistes chrysophthalmus]|nr:MAG: hypothetical protein LQ350_008514 [Niorma chrysophthalma]
MTGFGGRKGPNVPHYLANLNAIPSEQDLATQQQDNFDFHNDLAPFTNTEFLDFDQGENFLQSPIDYNDELNGADSVAGPGDGSAQDFDFQFAPIDPFLTSEGPLSITHPPLPLLPQTPFPTSPTTYHPQPHPQPTTTTNKRTHPPPTTTTTTTPSTPSSSNPPAEPTARLAAEEDKRRRNTAASARFRVKKKQREQALEKTAKELGDRARALEQKVAQLQTQNEWLKGLVVEKRGEGWMREEWRRRGGGGVEGEKEKEGEGEREGEQGERRAGGEKEGVGTATAAAAAVLDI